MGLRRSVPIVIAVAAGVGFARRKDLGRRVRYLRGCLRGDLYRALGHEPEPDVGDDILVDRVRSRLGPISKALDVPHVHVMVNDRVVMLHGDVADAADALALEEAAGQTAGVRGVVSLLHEGLLRSDTRPSEGLRHQRSAALQRLLKAAREAGCGRGSDLPCVRAVLAVFFRQLPFAESQHLASQLPNDVRRLAPLRRPNDPVMRLSGGAGEFVQAVMNIEPAPPGTESAVVSAVLRTLRELVPVQAADVEPLLPPELRALLAPGSSGN